MSSTQVSSGLSVAQSAATEGHLPGGDPDHTSYRTFASFTDPDGNSFLLQEITDRLPGRCD
jgi:hypothetical protein